MSARRGAAIDRDAFLIELYQLFPAAPPAQFIEAVLELLKKRVFFDSALWGTFAHTSEGPRGHRIHLHRLPEAMLREYDRIKHLDVVNRNVVGKPARTTNVALSRVAPRTHPDAVAHARRWGMEHTLATACEESQLSLFTLLSLYRSDPRRPFTEPERRFKQAVMPHLVASWHMNAIHFLGASTGARHVQARARALVDRFGVIDNAEPGLANLLRSESPAWRGPVLPAPLLAIVRGETGAWNGTAIVAALERKLDDGAVVISVRRRVPVDELSARELQVAREFASGKSHKEIAALLGTSPATVRSQIQSVYTKLGVDKKVDLLRQLDESS